MKIYEHLGKATKSNVTELVGIVKLKQPTVSYHLKEMEGAGLVQSQRSGKEVFYKISGKCPYDNIECVLK